MFVGQVLQERYHLVARVHGNADRDTYVALDKSAAPDGDNTCAQYILKHFHPPESQAGPRLEKCLQTAAQIQQLNHLSPQMPQLLQYWLEADQFFLAYEYIDSQNLLGELSSQTEHQVMSLLGELIEILQPLHQQQIAHGNLHTAQLSRRMTDRQLIVTDLGSLAFTDRQSFGDPNLLAQDLQALGQIAGLALAHPEEPAGFWRSRTTPQFLALIDRLCADCPPSLMEAWLDLGKLMHRFLTDQETLESPECRTPQDQLGHLPEAIADYSQSLERLPNLALVYWERALVHQEMGEMQAALADLNEFLIHNPFHGEAYLRRAHLQELQRELDLAVADCDRAIECNPSAPEAYFQRGNLRASQQEYALAVADYSQSLALDDRFAPAYQRRGAIYYQQGEVEKARYDYLQAISLAPSAALYYQYGLMADDRRMALDSFDRALALEPHRTKIYCQRAGIFQKEGQLDWALADYDRALEFEPESIEALCGRGVIRQKLADYGGASSDYQRAANLFLDRGQQVDYERLLRVLESLPKAIF